MGENNGHLDLRNPQTRGIVLGNLPRPAILDEGEEQRLLQVLALRAVQTRRTILRANGQVDLGTVAPEQFAAIIRRERLTDAEYQAINTFAQDAFRRIAVAIRDGVRQTTGQEL